MADLVSLLMHQYQRLLNPQTFKTNLKTYLVSLLTRHHQGFL